jgi:hypothetical protein
VSVTHDPGSKLRPTLSDLLTGRGFHWRLLGDPWSCGCDVQFF